jgi:CDP-paratose 2-epimerase
MKKGCMVKNYLVTGGAGFIGSNYVNRLLKRGEKVTIYDNLSRAGSKMNLRWLIDEYGENSFNLVIGDVRDSGQLVVAARKADVIIHLAAQVAVTTSVIQPREDFEINAIGTFNVMEAARLNDRKPVVIYASTNKVYGGMEEVKTVEKAVRYEYADYPTGIPESLGLDFHSPYGCSKGCGDQYVRDYARIYDIPSVVLRQSCIYGPRQFGVEDQGWVAWFIIAAVTGRPITIYGDGKQVRDILFVEDLLNAYDAAVQNVGKVGGKVYNIGGGAGNTLAIWTEFSPLLEKLCGHKIKINQGDWRPGDQAVYISNIAKAQQELNWMPKVGVEEGITRLYQWVVENRQLFG